MPQSLSAIRLHAVFSTKGRQPYLREPMFRKDMHSYLAGISKSLDCPPHCIGGVEDHVHILAGLGRTMTVADWIKELKRASSIWAKQSGHCAAFAWQAGYGVFSVSESNMQAVREYIENQEAHHAQCSFQDEYRTLLRKHGIEWDEQYVWD